MNRSFLLLLSTATFLSLAACGIDTTGISADSSKQPAGLPTSSIVVTEYADLQCPACKGAYELINKPLMEKYADRIRVDFKHFPLQGIHPFALEAGEAAECAADQGKFWEFVDVAYTNQADLSSAKLRVWAKDLGLDTVLFERCLGSRIKKKTVLADYAEGEKMGVNSTPTYFVNGQKIGIGQASDLETAVETALTQAESAPL